MAERLPCSLRAEAIKATQDAHHEKRDTATTAWPAAITQAPPDERSTTQHNQGKLQIEQRLQF